MPSFERWAGKATEQLTLSANITLSARVRVQRVAATTTGIEVALPDARRIGSLGGPVLVVWNTGSNAIDVTDNGGTVQATLAQDELALCFLIANADADGDWRLKVEPTDAIPIGGINDFFVTIGGDAAYVRSPWKYDHVGNSWSAGTDASVNMVQAPGFAAAGIGYVIASVSAYPMQQYDPDTWTTLSNASRGPAHMSGAADELQGDVYGSAITSTATIHDRYDITGDTFSAGTALASQQRMGGADNVEAGTNLIHGGFDFFSNAVQTVQAHATVGDTFTGKTNMTTDSRGRHGHFNLGGDVFVVAGFEKIASTAPRSSVYSYQLAGDAWTSRTAWPPGAVGDGPSCGTRAAGVAYAVGGQSADDARSYQVDTWTTLADHAAATQIRWCEDSSMALVF